MILHTITTDKANVICYKQMTTSTKIENEKEKHIFWAEELRTRVGYQQSN